MTRRESEGPVLLTGAASGIGAATARMLLDRGVRVVGLDRSPRPEELDEAGWLQCDLGTLVTAEALAPVGKALQSAIGGPGPFRTVILGAGISAVGHAASLPADAQRAVIRVNLLAPLVLARMLVALGLADARTRWVLISSLSHFTGYPGAAAYAASKDGVVALGRCLRRLPGRPAVCLVYPGPTDTPHATRFSPDGKGHRGGRMPATRVAGAMLRASRKGRRMCCPGPAAALFMLLGTVFPRGATALMRTIILKRLGPDQHLLDRSPGGRPEEDAQFP